MHFLRTRVELLAEHLRQAILRGDLVSPLPNIRDWSTQLGVSHGTLEKALQILKREGAIRTRPRKGVHVVPPEVPRPSLQQPPVARWIFYGASYKNVPTVPEILSAIGQKLSPHGIRFSLEMCNDSRLRAIHQQGERSHEMLLMSSMTEQYQRLFSDFKKSVLLIGPPFPGIELPYVSNDVISAIRHATFMLARRGFERISLVLNESSRQPLHETFQQICSAAPRPIQGEVIRLPDELHEQNLAAQRLAARIVARHALIAASPVPPGLLIMTLMRRGLQVPGDSEVVAVNTTSLEIRTCPIPIHYPYPMEKFAKTVCHAAIHYFEQGSVPPLRKLIPMHLVSPSR